MDLIMSLFSFLGSGKDEDEEDTMTETASATKGDEVCLTEVMPVTGALDETLPESTLDVDEDEGDMMAA